jgi:cytoskeletal protein CcmA (bactofilin family)
VVQGEVNGNITAKNAVEVHRTAKVRGSIETRQLMVEKGSLFQGQVKMATDERAPAVGKSAAAPGTAALQ